MIGLYMGEAFPLGMLVIGLLYALFFDPKSTLPKGSLKRLK